jgi:hypothetical protein
MLRYISRVSVGLIVSLLTLIVLGCNTMSKSVSVIEGGLRCRQVESPGMSLTKGTQIQNAGSVMLSNKSLKSAEPLSQEDDDYWTVRVDMGRKPSSGYGLKLLSDKLLVADQVARFGLKWIEPAPGRVQAQVISYPCLYLKVEKGEYNRLEAVDESGRAVHVLDLP